MDPTLIARRFGSVTAHLEAVLDLTQHAIAADLLCGDEELLGPHGPRCPAIARAADDVGFDGILAPSAAMPGAHTLVVFRRAALHLTVRDVDPEVYGPPRQPKR